VTVFRYVRRVAIAALVALAALVAAGCGGADDTPAGGSAAASSGKGSTRLSLVAYSTPQVVYDEAIPAFKKTQAGKEVGFTESYGPSGDQSRAVESGLAADIVAFSLEPDITRLVKDGIVSANWKDAPHEGIVSDSVVVFVVRKGNPKNIHTWDDLLEPGIEVVTPNPFQSGGARWNLLAAYGANGALNGDPNAGLDYVRELITKHVKVQDKSARDALHTFTGGEGDVMLAYENEAITAQQKGEDIDHVIPQDTLLIETPIAVTMKSKNPEAAKAFVDYLWSPAGQRTFAKHGYRPVDKAVFNEFKSDFPTPKALFTVAGLDGWTKLNDELFDPDKGQVAKIEEAAGVSTAK
jgi:sulfate/thiosulfate-binding protein